MSLVKRLARVVSIPIRKWREFWLLDLTPEQEQILASRFRTPEEQQQWLEDAKEHNRLLRKQYFQHYAKTHILPGIHMGSSMTADTSTASSSNSSSSSSSSFFPKQKFLSSYIQFRPSPSPGYRRGFSDFNRKIFILIVSGIPLLISTLYIYYFNLQYPREQRKKTLLGYALPFIPENKLQSPNFDSSQSNLLTTLVKEKTKEGSVLVTQVENKVSSLPSSSSESSSNKEHQHLEQKLHDLENEVHSLQQQIKQIITVSPPNSSVSSSESPSRIPTVDNGTKIVETQKHE